MARHHGKNTVVTIDGNDMSNFISDSTFSATTDTHDTTAYGMDSKEYIGGLTDGTFSCEGHYDDDAAGPRAIIKPIQVAATAVTVIRQPEGAGTGLEQDSFSAICTAYDESSPVDDKVSWSSEWQISGDITITAQA